MDNIIWFKKDGKTVLLNRNNMKFVRVNNEMLKDKKMLSDILEEKYDFFLAQEGIKRKKLYYTMTRKCNLNCSFCANESSPVIDTKDDMSIETLREYVIPKLIKMKFKEVILSGGEPFIKEDFREILQLFCNAFGAEHIGLQSNGLLIDEEKAEFIRNKVGFVELSIENVVETDDLQCKMEAIFSLLKSKHIEIVFSYVVTNENKGLIRKAFDLAVKYKAILQLKFVAPVGRALKNKIEIDERDILNEYLEMINYVIEKKYFFDELRGIFFPSVSARRACGALGDIIAMQSNGDLYMCPNLKGSDYYYGNIVSEEFEEIQKKIENKIHNNNSHKEFWVDERKMCEDCEVKFFCTGACRAEINKCKDYEERLCTVNRLFYKFILFEYDRKSDMESNIYKLKKYIEAFTDEERAK